MQIEECLELLLKEAATIQTTEYVPITEAYGRISAEDICSPVMVPSFPKSAMDGYAVKAMEVLGATKDKPVSLRVLGELCAGDYVEYRHEPMTAVRVMTGAYVPEGFDAVVRQEDSDYGEKEVTLYAGVKEFANYCKIGEDIVKGQLVIAKKTRLMASHIGLLASMGMDRTAVVQSLRTAIISTGTELCAVGDVPANGKIYNSIAYMLQASICKEGLEVVSMETCADEEELLMNKIENAVMKADVVITTGAVSVGKKDIIPAVLQRLGARVLFAGADIQPGTPTMASVYKGRLMLHLSGNPYAAIANFELYFWPLAAKMMDNESYRPVTAKAELACEYNKVNRSRRLIRAYAKGGRVTIPSDIHSSSVIHNLTDCNCFIDLEAGRAVQTGDYVTIRFFKG